MKLAHFTLAALFLSGLAAANELSARLPQHYTLVPKSKTVTDEGRFPSEWTLRTTPVNPSTELPSALEGELRFYGADRLKGTEVETHYSGRLQRRGAKLKGLLRERVNAAGGVSSELAKLGRAGEQAEARTIQLKARLNDHGLIEDVRLEWSGGGNVFQAKHVSGSRPVGSAWHALPAEVKQERLSALASLHPYPADALPQNLPTLRAQSPSLDEDVLLRPRWKQLQYQLGATAAAVYKPAAGHGYTGLFAEETPAMVRLSQNVVGPGSYGVGLELKLFVDRRPSQNLHASKSFDRRPPALLSPLEVFSSSDHVAAVRRDGSGVAAPRAPQLLELRPVDSPSSDSGDFRLQLAQLAANTPLYTVHDEEGRTLGTVYSTSRFVAGDAQDRILHFARK